MVPMTNSQNEQTDWKWIFTMLLMVAGIIGVGAMNHYEIGRMYAQIEGADRRMARVETAVHILADSQGEKTRTMVDEALTISQNAAASSAELLGNVKGYLDSGDKVRAAEVAYNAHELLMTAKENKSPVPPGYFASTIALLNNMPNTTDTDISSRLLSARVALAEYHSALQAGPELPDKEVTLKVRFGRILCGRGYEPRRCVSRRQPAHAAGENGLAGAGRRGGWVGNPSGTDLLSTPGGSLAQNGDSMSGLTLSGVTQTLDGVEWKDVTFVNSRVRYHGGDLKLENVHFVHCTFEVPVNSRGAQLADYATLENGALNIG